MSLSLHGASVIIRGRTILDDANIACAPGRVTAILGPNGAGKTTALSLLAGERRPDRGTAALDGRCLSLLKPDALARRRALMPQFSAPAFGLPVWAFVGRGRAPHGDGPAETCRLVAEALKQARALDFAEREVTSLSGGERQRVCLARALVQVLGAREAGPRYLLLDEPIAALDIRQAHEVLGVMRAAAHDLDLGVVCVLHDLAAASRIADDCVLLSEGRIAAAGPPGTVLTREMVAAVYEVPGEVAAGALGRAA